MTRFKFLLSGFMLVPAVALYTGCADDTPALDYEPREVTEYSKPAPAPQPATAARDPHAGLDPHTMAHPPISPPLADDEAIKLNPHPDWTVKAPRPLTMQVFSLPAVEGDPKDGDLAVSFLGQHIPLEANVERWCGQFELPQGTSCEDVQQRDLEGTKYPTTVVEIAGAFVGGSMFAPAGPPEPDFVMLVAEIRTPDKPWYLRLLGPERTVRHWEQEFLRFAREAE